jgi:uncharacterized membrane protein YkvA (DUF1232 family)
MMLMEPFPREEALALIRRIPAYGVLAVQLGRDPGLARGRRSALIAAAAYLVSPIDAVPGFIPLAGQLDDLIVVLVALRFALAGMTPQQRQQHLEAVGLSEAILAADERALMDIGSWTLRAAADAAGVVSRAGLQAGARASQEVARLGRGSVRRIGDVVRRGRGDASPDPG